MFLQIQLDVKITLKQHKSFYSEKACFPEHFQLVCNNIKSPGFQMTHQHFVWVHSGDKTRVSKKALCFARKHSCETPPEGLRNTREGRQTNSTF